jgi:hypothetical protein
MSPTSETGHAKNLSAFQSLISFCKGYGAAYNPARAALSTKEMDLLLASAQAALSATKSAEMAFGNATNQRGILFKNLKPFATQLVNALAAFGATAETVKDARSINRKIQGRRAVPIPKVPGSGDQLPAGNTISVSQQSYVQQADHFNRLIELLAEQRNYTPNEESLKVPTLRDQLAGLHAANAAVTDTYTNWSNSRGRRGKLFYSSDAGFVPLALDAKKYIRAIFGSSSTEYMQVSGLRLKTLKH